MKNFLAVLFSNSIEILSILIIVTIAMVEISFFSDLDSYLNDIGIYFYSSLLQANAALISIVAIFFIFRIQSLQSTIEGYYNALIASSENNYERTLFHNFRSHTLEEKQRDIQAGNYNEEVHKEIMLSSIGNIKRIDKIKYAIMYPIILLILGIIINIIGLLLTNFLHSLGSYYEIKVFLSVFVFELLCLLTLIKGIYKSIK